MAAASLTLPQSAVLIWIDVAFLGKLTGPMRLKRPIILGLWL
ncbi:hypothetical protein PSYJA_06966 [Pseudomonas syringae pv. japonica str. M301072]|uniref:Uncharacterized protein n=1 Tax=Pseudomonas syringae pv. japonica str. M301072 TaxID=629262 RepID=F3FET9_PSESX|nr:hypothetical protein PSYJA_06966 [Pseudomonas syringae pv. japonica str. M301072]